MTMTTVLPHLLLLEAAVLAASFGMLWLSFCVRDRRGLYPEMQPDELGHQPLVDLATSEQHHSTKLGPSVLGSAASGVRLAIDLTSCDVQLASKRKAVLHRP
jgi:hypothetical protein